MIQHGTVLNNIEISTLIMLNNKLNNTLTNLLFNNIEYINDNKYLLSLDVNQLKFIRDHKDKFKFFNLLNNLIKDSNLLLFLNYLVN